MRVAVIGGGYVGIVTAACLAETGNDVLCADVDVGKVERLSRGDIPIFEPGLETLVRQNLEQSRLRFTTDVGAAVEHARVVLIAVGTPPRADGSADLAQVEAVARVIGDHLNEVKIIANKSTVPVGTARHVADIIRTRTEQPFHIASNPEFLKQGAAVSDFMRPDRVIIGVDSSEAQDIMAELYAPFVMSGNPILFMDIASAELAKYAANAMLAMRISFMNQMADLCERVGANVMDVRRGIASDNRIGSAFLYPGPGYGGSCLPKDVKALLHTSRSLGLEADLFSAIERVNERQKTVLLRKVLHRLGRNLEGVALGVWGLAFKAGTDDMRDSPAIPLIQGLLEAGAIVRAHDPKASDAARSVFGDSITYVADPYEAARDASAVIVLTEWLQYRTPDFERLRDLMHRPLFIDGRNLYEGERMDRHGFEYESIGRPPLVRVEAGREP